MVWLSPDPATAGSWILVHDAHASGRDYERVRLFSLWLNVTKGFYVPLTRRGRNYERAPNMRTIPATRLASKLEFEHSPQTVCQVFSLPLQVFSNVLLQYRTYAEGIFVHQRDGV